MSAEGFHELLSRAQSGDAVATDRLMAVIRQCMEEHSREGRAVSSADGDSDLVQTAALRAWRSLDQFRGARDDMQAWLMFRSWLATIMSRVRTNEARDRKRQRRRPAQGIVALNPTRGDTTDAIGVDPIANGPTPGTCAQRREEAELVRAAIDKLPDDIGRQIIVLRFFDELSLQQIAHRTGLSYDKVRERYRACMKLVEQELADLL